MKTDKTFFEIYCTGCGLCRTVHHRTFTRNPKGYKVPDIDKETEVFCSKICPASGYALKNYQDGTIWGTFLKSALGWSANPIIRQASSSGGILTSLCLFLLEHKLVDGIIQTKPSRTDIRETETIVSYTKEDILACMGSRYTTSSPLMQLKELMRQGETYAFVGKPCDISALKIYIEEIEPELKKQILYLFSFFCAGQPSLEANNKLIHVLGGKELEDCQEIQYRGNGWPGFAKLIKKDGSQKMMDYETSWMKILGRDVRRICRFCADGTGELADISCGDAWYLGSNNRPDFTERPGRNVVFARTEKGVSLLKKIEEEKIIILEDFDPKANELRKMQPYHYTRKASLLTYKWALRLCGQPFPCYDSHKLKLFAKGFSTKQKILRFFGTIQRISKGTI